MTKRYKVMMENIHLTGTLAQKCVGGWINHYDIIIDTLTGKEI